MWFHQMHALRARYRVIAYDQRGHGETDAPSDPRCYSPQILARDLIGLLDALGIARAAIVGFSLGGGPALALAATKPERVSRLVLADVGAGADNMWKSTWLSRRWTDLIDRGDANELVCDMLRSEFFKRYATRNERSRNYMASLIRATPISGLRSILSEVIAKRKSVHRMSPVLRALKIPTLVALGRHDNVCRAPARFMAGIIPGATLKWIEDAGHMSPLENPGGFTESIGRFLAAETGS
jgi:pimeloyl-ACP methyl ester carboxylesterase